MSAAGPPVGIRGAGALSAHGAGWVGLGRALLDGARYLRPSIALARSHPGTAASEIDALPEPDDPRDKRARMLMSRPALFASVATRAALAAYGQADKESGGSARGERLGLYLGVGASGGSMEQLTAMLGASIEAQQLSLARFGDAGLRACNPLFAFQLMNNFTLCHSAMLHGIGGPNAAFFSRGSGTVAALSEAVHALREGDCTRALAGAADSCVHPVTWAELCRDGHAARGLIPGEAAGVLALQAGLEGALAQIDHCAIHPAWAGALAAIVDDAAPAGAAIDGVVLAPWGTPPRAELTDFIRRRLADVPIVDITAALGESLAASPALAWIVALDLLRAGVVRRALTLTAGVDGDLGVAVFSRGAAP